MAALEDELDPGPARQNQSAIVLVVDIKQVPSPQEEGLHIADPVSPDTGSAPTVAINQSRRRNQSWKAIPASIISTIKRLISWKIGGFIPALPVLLVAGAVVALFLSLNSDQEWQPQFGPNQALIANATSTIAQAQEVADVNPDRALDLLNQAEESIQEGLTDYPQNQELLALQSQHDQLKQQVLIITELKPEEIASINATLTQSKLIFDDGNIYFIDGQKQELISVSLNGQSGVIASDFRFAQGALLTLTDAGIMVVSRGQTLPLNANGSIGQPGQLPDTVQPISTTGFIQNGYILEATGQIYRLPHQTDSIGTISSYFQRPVGGSTLVDVAVDGNVYLLRQDGTIDVYLNGEKQAFTPERASLANQGRALFATPESDELYVLQNAAVIAWNKQGKYLGQYQFKSQAEWQMATIDTENNTLYVIADNTLYRADLP